MNENPITAKLISLLNGVPKCRARKRHGGRFQSGDPDVAGCVQGRAFFIEVKMDTGELTKLQAAELERWRESGAATAVAIWIADKKAFQVMRPDKTKPWMDLAGKVKIPKDIPAEWLRPMSHEAWVEWLGNEVLR